MTIGKPLDLQDIFVNTLAGSMEIFFFIAMLFFAYLAARFKMPNSIFLILIGVFVIFLSSFYPTMYAFVVFIIGLLAFYSISKIMKD